MMKQDEIDQALSFDPLDAAERLTGESLHDHNSSAVTLGFLLMHKSGAHKDRLLKAAKDTYFNIPMTEFLTLLEANGFQIVLTEDVRLNPRYDEGGNKFRMAWNGSVLLVFDSYRGDTVINGGHAYYCYNGPYMNDHGSCSWVLDENRETVKINDLPVIRGHHDIREGLFHKLSKLSKAGTLMSKWIGTDFLWLLHYMDTKDENGDQFKGSDGYDYKAINRTRFAKLPQEVQDAIGDCNG
jgi:hypothetical protein